MNVAQPSLGSLVLAAVSSASAAMKRPRVASIAPEGEESSHAQIVKELQPPPMTVRSPDTPSGRTILGETQKSGTREQAYRRPKEKLDTL